MNKVKSPFRMQGLEFGNLQDALQVLLKRDVVASGNEDTRRQLGAALKPECIDCSYGSLTCKLVAMFQETRQLEPTGNGAECDRQSPRVLCPPSVTPLTVESCRRAAREADVAALVSREIQRCFFFATASLSVTETKSMQLFPTVKPYNHRS